MTDTKRIEEIEDRISEVQKDRQAGVISRIAADDEIKELKKELSKLSNSFQNGRTKAKQAIQDRIINGRREQTPRYKVGQTITVKTFGGERRNGKVTDIDEKDGQIIYGYTSMDGKEDWWTYEDQIQ